MALETQIGCCEASTCIKIVAWIHIVTDVLYFLGVIVTIADYDPNSEKNVMGIGELSVHFAVSLLGIVMAILLLIGNNQKRVGFLKAWLIYGGITTVLLVIAIISDFIGDEADKMKLAEAEAEDEVPTDELITNIVFFAFNIFTFVVVYIRMKDISE